MPPSQTRRPIAARSSAWARALAGWLARSQVTPNQISGFSVLVAGLGAGALLILAPIPGLLCFALSIQLRLVCNLLDGMVAVEGGKKSALGALYNEFPDRLADSLLIVAAGYAVGLSWLGWWGALAAALTAYVRVFGGALGLEQRFNGVMAKPQRMAVLTVAAILGAVEWGIWDTRYALTVGAWLVAVGASVTCVTRTLEIARQLEE
ncbi:CDP-alcohol phosphatidyltransferase family protein [Deinococcus sp.]|uniref:CDP-alcohol phosphatidyltransferase family protein n=1 Tax=Deinococcus sp. TaxID=47478 RepID=UPI0025F0BFDF|nr:CDP-alcohol phosphatidyltransferase family protein [Deinococcus sp.]